MGIAPDEDRKCVVLQLQLNSPDSASDSNCVYFATLVNLTIFASRVVKTLFRRLAGTLVGQFQRFVSLVSASKLDSSPNWLNLKLNVAI